MLGWPFNSSHSGSFCRSAGIPSCEPAVAVYQHGVFHQPMRLGKRFSRILEIVQQDMNEAHGISVKRKKHCLFHCEYAV